jgi:hypothetical protein
LGIFSSRLKPGGTGSTHVGDAGLLACYAAGKVALHLAFPATNFAVHPDFFVDLGRQHTDWGFSNETPYGPALVLLARLAPWDPVFSVVYLPVLLGAGAVFLAGLLARELGAGRFGQFLTAFSLLVSPYCGRIGGSMHSSNVELLLWTLAAFLVARILNGAGRWRWLAIGVVCGLGLVNKQTMALFVAGIAAGLVATPARKHLSSGWLWAGCAAGLLVVSPYLCWQFEHGWPVVGHAREVCDGPAGWTSIPGRLAGQLLFLNIANLPLVVLGIVFCFLSPGGHRFRPFGILALVALGAATIAGGKVIYGMPAYVILLAAGSAMAADRLSAGRRRWPRVALVAFMAAGGVLMAPLSYPIIPPRAILSFFEASALDGALPGGVRGRVEVFYCRDIALSNFADVIAAAYRRLPEREKRDCVLFTNQPMETAAVNVYGPKLGLPRAYSRFDASRGPGPGGPSGQVMIAVDVPVVVLGMLYERVEPVTTLPALRATCRHKSVPDTTIDVCRGLRVPFTQTWRLLMAQTARCAWRD